MLHVLYLPNIPFMWWSTYLIWLYMSSIALYEQIFLGWLFFFGCATSKKKVILGGLHAGGLVQSSWPWLKVGDGCPLWPREKLLGGKTQLHKKEWDRNGVVEQVMFIFIVDWHSAWRNCLVSRFRVVYSIYNFNTRQERERTSQIPLKTNTSLKKLHWIHVFFLGGGG